MKKILITGVHGFTGRYLALELSRAGYEVHGLLHSNCSDDIPGLARSYFGNLLDLARIEEIVCDVRPDKVAHLAAISYVAHGDIDAMYRTNIVGTRNLLEALARTSIPLSAVLLCSTANIYGNSERNVLDESTPLAPTNDYAISKVAMEYLGKMYAHRIPLVISRPFNYTGLGQHDNFIIPKIVNHVRLCAPVIELGNIDVARDFSDVRTVVQYYARLLEAPAAVGGIFNVCSGFSYTLRQVLEITRLISGRNLDVRVNPEFVRKNDVKILRGDCQKLTNTVGEVAAIPFEQTLRWMLGA